MSCVVIGVIVSAMPPARTHIVNASCGMLVSVWNNAVPDEAGGDQQHPGHPDTIGAEAADELRRVRGHGHHHDREGQHVHGGLERRVIR